MEKGDLKSKSFAFSLKVATMSRKLEEEKRYSFASQLFKSGTSIGANIREAGNSESRQDFIHKLKIAIKEAEETEYWLELLRDTTKGIYEKESSDDLRVIIRMLAKSIISAKRNQKIKKTG